VAFEIVTYSTWWLLAWARKRVDLIDPAGFLRFRYVSAPEDDRAFATHLEWGKGMRGMRITRVIEMALLLGAMLPGLRADPAACTSMLIPLFNWAAQDNHNTEYPVYATITKHYASQSTNQSFDSVQYSNGRVFRHTNVLGGLPWFQSDLPRLSSTRNFVPDSSLTTMIYVRQDGYVGYQEKIYGKPVGGMPPTYFQGTCSGGLITTVIGSNSYTVSFTTMPPKPIIP
jgi:hypothetical protein